MNFLCQLGEFGCVYKGIWTQTTVEKEEMSDVVAIKTIKSMYTCVYQYIILISIDRPHIKVNKYINEMSLAVVNHT